MKPVHPIALFRLSVLGPLASRERFERGELTRITQELWAHERQSSVRCSSCPRWRPWKFVTLQFVRAPQ